VKQRQAPRSRPLSDYRRKQEIFTREAETRRLRKGRD
jgi:hypothetical protein